MDAPEPKLDRIFDMHVDLEAPQVVGPTPQGMRQIFVVKGGTIEGPKLKGTLLPGGGDWALVRSDGAIQLDVRATLRTDDGAMIYGYYGGIISAEPEVFGRLLQGQDVPLNEYYFYVNPIFQTAAPNYAWLNKVVCVGRGKVVPGGVEYRVWALANGG